MIVNCLTGPRTQWHIPGQPAAQQQQLQPETFEKSRLLRQGRQLARNTYSPTQLHLQKWGDCSARLLFLCFVSLAYCASVVLCVCVWSYVYCVVRHQIFPPVDVNCISWGAAARVILEQKEICETLLKNFLGQFFLVTDVWITITVGLSEVDVWLCMCQLTTVVLCWCRIVFLCCSWRW